MISAGRPGVSGSNAASTPSSAALTVATLCTQPSSPATRITRVFFTAVAEESRLTAPTVGRHSLLLQGLLCVANKPA